MCETFSFFAGQRGGEFFFIPLAKIRRSHLRWGLIPVPGIDRQRAASKTRPRHRETLVRALRNPQRRRRYALTFIKPGSRKIDLDSTFYFLVQLLKGYIQGNNNTRPNTPFINVLRLMFM